jgi:hypothetical protein
MIILIRLYRAVMWFVSQFYNTFYLVWYMMAYGIGYYIHRLQAWRGIVRHMVNEIDLQEVVSYLRQQHGYKDDPAMLLLSKATGKKYTWSIEYWPFVFFLRGGDCSGWSDTIAYLYRKIKKKPVQYLIIDKWQLSTAHIVTYCNGVLWNVFDLIPCENMTTIEYLFTRHEMVDIGGPYNYKDPYIVRW